MPGPSSGVRRLKQSKRAGQQTISRKISHLVRKEGKSQKAAVGQALGMARGGDLGPAAKRAAGRKP
jgi:hypothetical protein